MPDLALSEQNKIVSLLEQLDDIRNRAAQSDADLRTLLPSLLQGAFGRGS